MTNESFKDWFLDNLLDYAEDIANHGADAGYPHVTYYTDTNQLFSKYGDEIWEMLVNLAEGIGYDNPAELLNTFGRKDMLSSLDSFKCLLVWFACEELAREIVDNKELD